MAKRDIFGRWEPQLSDITGLDESGVRFEAKCTSNEIELLARDLEKKIEAIRLVENFWCGMRPQYVFEVVLRWGADRLWSLIGRLEMITVEYDLRRAQAEVYNITNVLQAAYEWDGHPAASQAHH